MDRATYLTLKREISLQVLVERAPAPLNYIAVIRVNPARRPRVNAEGARAFPDRLVSDEVQQLITAFEVDRYGEPLFFPDSDDWRKRHGGAS
jgi:tungstate transport system substrate-binding protein